MLALRRLRLLLQAMPHVELVGEASSCREAIEAIARLAPDGMPIASISFSLKSNVAKRWLHDQGVSFQEAPNKQAAGLPADRLVEAFQVVKIT